MDKYVLVRPRGGLNDILCQIGTAWRYAENHNRQLIIDTEESGLLDDFSTYFVLNDTTKADVHLSHRGFLTALENKTYVPSYTSIDATKYEVIWNDEARNYTRSGSNDKATFDFERDYDEDVLTHHQCGGGEISLEVMKKVQLSEPVLKKVLSALETLPSDYVAIHVRNTDLQTDYRAFFESLVGKVNKRNVLVCSDDRACIDFANEFFTDASVYSVSDIPDTSGKPLHMNAGLDRYQANVDMIVDLICLANAKQLHLTRVAKGFLSGFSRLAKNLNQNQDILKSVLGRP